METIELLAAFADPATIADLKFSQKMLAGLITTLLGMGITFLALVILQAVIVLLGRLSQPKTAATAATKAAADASTEQPPSPADDEQLVAAITTALALMLDRAPGAIVIRNISKIDQTPSAWAGAGIADQMRNGSTGVMSGGAE